MLTIDPSQFHICASMFWDQRIVLVGGGGPRVDVNEYDFVMWTNTHWRAPMRIDGLFTIPSLEPPTNLPMLRLLAIESCPSRFQRDWTDHKRARVQFGYCIGNHQCVCPEGAANMIYQQLAQAVRCKPFTGFSALAFLMQFPFKELMITGFDFYRRASDGVIPYANGPHIIPPHIDYLRELQRRDCRIKFDAVLSEICTPLPEPQRVIHAIETEDRIIWRVHVEEMKSNVE